METAIKYDRMSGYFGSSVFLVINEALKKFIENNGHMRIICSPILSDEDIVAIQKGYSEKIEQNITRELNIILDEIYLNHSKATLLLSKLISSGYLEIKLAVFENNQQAFRLMHDKAGVFTDQFQNSVSFRGSINETFKGVSSFGNSESFDVDTSWGEGKEQIRANLVIDQFNNMWNGCERGITTIPIPDLTLEKIKSFKTDRGINELIDEITVDFFPHEEPKIDIILPYIEFVVGEKVKLSISNNPLKGSYIWSVNDDNLASIDNNGVFSAIKSGKVTIAVSSMNNPLEKDEKNILIVKWGAEPGPNRRKTRPYQEEILNNWEKNNRIGLFEMATGSGKTFTAMCAVRDAIYCKGETPIIIVPRKILYEQWKEEVKKVFTDDVIVYEFGNGRNDFSQINLSTTKTNRKKILISTLQTASKEEFISKINQGNHLFLIIDEVHNVGSDKYSNLLNLRVGSKIGLSATPKRFRDPIGTKKMFDYFDKSIEPKYSLGDAIRDKNLCEYFYYPKKVELDSSESSSYLEISRQITKRYAMLLSQDKTIPEIFNDNRIRFWLIQRADIIKKAKSKIELVRNILMEKYEEGQRWLIYCDDTDQLGTIKADLYKSISHKFHNDLFEYFSKSNLKDKTLDIFELNGGVLMSINCLDEGVDIPSIDHAIILSSSQNERQFIQRRGRVLRKFNSKAFSYIYDAIVAPDDLESENEDFTFLIYELKRAILFAKSSVNKEKSLMDIKEMAIKNNIDIDSLFEEDRGTENE
jgi:superfamily II DNA or RNA helicase